jgi:Lipopolysaccharide kinase (Kdo/WaaP) family
MLFLPQKKEIFKYFSNCLQVGSKRVFTNLSGGNLINAQDFLLALPADGSLQADFIENVQVKNEKKTVYRVIRDLVLGSGESFIFKVFSFPKFRYRLRDTWKPLDELFNLIKAGEAGMPVPEIYGFYVQADGIGLTRSSGILMEEMHGYEPLGLLLEKADFPTRKKLLDTISAVLRRFYQSGCLHIDLNSGAVLVNRQDYSDYRIIDFQHAQFFEKANEESIIFMTAYICKGIHPFFAGENKVNDLFQWADEFLSSVALTQKKKCIAEKFEFYFKSDLRRKQRRSIR